MTDTSSATFTSVGVIGLGTMGAGIAEVFARNGYSVIGVEVSDAALQRGREHLEHSTGRAVKREKMTQEAADELLGRITLTTEMQDLADADLVVLGADHRPRHVMARGRWHVRDGRAVVRGLFEPPAAG